MRHDLRPAHPAENRRSLISAYHGSRVRRNGDMIRTLRLWIEAARPRTLPVSVAGVLCAFAYAIEDGFAIDWTGWVCLIFALMCQIASNFANEYFDYKAGRDAPGREGPRRGVTEGDISPKAMLGATMFTLALACCLGLSLLLRGGWWMMAVGIAVVLGVYAYSAGPWPLSTHGLGEVAVLVFFGVVPVCCTYWLISGADSCVPLKVVAASIGIGCFGANVLVVNNFRDIPDDRAVGKRTLAVRFGRKAMMVLYAVNVIVAAGCLFPGFASSMGWGAWIVAILMTAAGLCFVAVMRRLNGRRLNPWLGRTAMMMVVFTLALLISAMI